MSLFETLRRRWTPTAPAVTTRGRTWSYGELENRALRAAAWLRSRGVDRGDIVAVRLGKELVFLDLHLACLALGAVFLPIHPAYTEREVTQLIEDSKAVLLVDDPAAVEAGWRSNQPLDPVALPSDTVGVLLYTSGTTGRPKGAQITHENLQATVSALHEAWRWSSEDVLIHALPLFHVHGLFVAQHGAMWAGAHAVWHERFDVETVLDALRSATVFMGVPTFYHRLLAAGLSDCDLRTMRLFTSGSAPLPAANHRAFEDATGHRILERYGMTEVGIVLSNPYDAERRAGAVGFPLPGVRLRICDHEDTPVEPGAVGEVQIAGPSVFPGYLNRPEATAKALRGGWMHTGDLGYQDSDGYVNLVGRSTDMILSGGMNVYPSEVEAVMLEHPGISEIAVFGVPDPDFGERVAAAVVPAAAWTPDVWLEHARQDLAPHKVPRRWFPVEALPRNAMGKVQKAVLRRTYGSDPEMG